MCVCEVLISGALMLWAVGALVISMAASGLMVFRREVARWLRAAWATLSSWEWAPWSSRWGASSGESRVSST
jgi:membrane protein implicated in regulation of membrane protease activity